MKTQSMKFLAAILLIIPSLGFSESFFKDGDKLIIGAVSHHFRSTFPNLNEEHPCIGFDRSGYELSYCKNSLDRWSVYATKLNTPWGWRGLDIGYRFGLANNYERKILNVYYMEDGTQVRHWSKDYPNGIRPVLLPVVQKEFKRFTIDYSQTETTIITLKYHL